VRSRRALSALLGILCTSVGAWLIGPAVQAQTTTLAYLQTFDGMPSSPAAYRPPGWDIQIHSRDSQTWTSVETMQGQHGGDCSPPPATFPLGGDYPSHVFQCHDHLMTALNASGYGVIYLTPPVLADWSRSPATVQWDMSTLRTSGRDWVDLWISPVADHLALPLDSWLPDLAGTPLRAVHLRLDTSTGGSTMRVETASGGVPIEVPSQTWVGYESVLTPDAARRDTFQVQLSRTHLRVGLPQYNLWWADVDIPDLGWDQGVVQFGHHSYNPQKDCSVPTIPAVQCAANTWHWDNVSISPSVPFQITELSPRQISDQARGAWTLPTPAPAGSYLQFAANSAPGFVAWGGDQGAPAIGLSFDGGRTWQTVQPQPSSAATTRDIGGARSYWVPLPAGTTAVQVQGTGAYGQGPWQAKDASVWTGPFASCTPRPAVGVSVATAGAGRLAVTVSTQNTPQASPNTVQMLQFLGSGATVQLDGQTYATPFTANLAVRAPQKTFVLQQPSSGQAVTMPLVVVDACGPWSTLVGGGASAFRGSAAEPLVTAGTPAPTLSGIPTAAPSATPTRVPGATVPASLAPVGLISRPPQSATPTLLSNAGPSSPLVTNPTAAPSAANASALTTVNRGTSNVIPNSGLWSPSIPLSASSSGNPALPPRPWMPLLGAPPALPAAYSPQWRPFGYPGMLPNWPPAYPGNPEWEVPPADVPSGATVAPDEPNTPGP
jgi:hypothetical protein